MHTVIDFKRATALLIAAGFFAGCSGGGGNTAPAPGPVATATPTVAPAATASATPATKTSATPTSTALPAATPTATPTSSATPLEGGSTTPQPSPVGTGTTEPANLPGLPARLYFPRGNFYGETIAHFSSPRQLAVLPNGDLLAGTTATTSGGSSSLSIVPAADTTAPGGNGASTFVSIPDTEAQGVAYSPVSHEIYIATTNGVWAVPYATGDRIASAAPVKIVAVRTGSIAPNSDGDVHHTTSVATYGNYLYIGVGSSCNRCTEVDPTRAVVMRTDLSGGSMTTVATKFRNPIALTVNPATGVLWAGGAGQDCLEPAIATQCPAQNDAYEVGHPFEFIDPVSSHGSATVDYGWPACEENRTSYASPAASCATQQVPAVAAPAYSTIIGAAIYPANQTGTYAFPTAYAGGLFMTFHGSWHENANGIPISSPNLVFVPLSGDAPQTAMNWSAGDPSSQWQAFVQGWQDTTGLRYGRPTGLAVGPLGSLFVADDQTGNIYRLRPGSGPSSNHRRR